MRDRHHISVFEYIMVALAVLIVVSLLMPEARAGGTDIVQSNDNNAQTTGDVANEVAVGGNRSRALALSGGDMDIDDGYRSYSYLFGLIQDTKSNPLEIARQLMLEGNYEAAAVLRCRPRGIYSAFGGREECVAALSLPIQAQPEPVSRSVEIEPPDDDEDEGSHMDDLEALRASVAQLQAEHEAQERESARQAARARQAAFERRQQEQAAAAAAADLLDQYQRLVNVDSEEGS